MFAIAPGQLAREHELLGHVDVDVLARFCEGAVERPNRDVAQHERGGGALAPRRIGERGKEALDKCKAAGAALRYDRHCAPCSV